MRENLTPAGDVLIQVSGLETGTSDAVVNLKGRPCASGDRIEKENGRFRDWEWGQI